MDQSFEVKPRLCFEIERVIGISSEGNIRSYQVQWAPAWVSGRQLVGCEHLIQEFLQKQQSQKESDGFGAEYDVSEQNPGGDTITVYQRDSYDLSSSIERPLKNEDEDILDLVSPDPDSFVKEVSPSFCTSDITSSSCNSLSHPSLSSLTMAGNRDIYEANNNIQDCDDIFDETYDSNDSKNITEKGDKGDIINITNVSYNQRVFTFSSSRTEDDTATSKTSIDTNSQREDSHRWKGSKERSHYCTYCDKVFIHKSHLTRHMLTHSNERPFKCDKCEKSFIRKDGLADHMWTHTKDKPYKCHQCDKAFARNSHLQKHLESHTKGNQPTVLYHSVEET